MKTIVKLLRYSLLALLVSGCGSGKQEAPGSGPAPAAQVVSSERQLAVESRKIIKEGVITFQTGSLQETRTKIDAALRASDGFMAKESENRYSDKVEQKVEVRVPAEKFDSFVRKVTEGVEGFDEKNISITDVTKEFIDVEARLKVKKETEQRYRELLGKAGKIEDILAIEKQIGELRSEIESVEGRPLYLRDAVALSSLTITFYENISAPATFLSDFGVGFKNGWNNLVQFIVIMVNAWPFFIIIPIVVIMIRRIGAKKAAKKQKQP
ncbi:DUF4349 domain-containing protein [Chlorobium sp. KB01]|uniref:DUF4349 domain-containing protein n=1 Tax=Chlorobium sp. KB01 TaxID=1917528 RepID=UPI000975E1EE|nr:DUF4349 domain-containing protein [Chlorobium sp. KB01]